MKSNTIIDKPLHNLRAPINMPSARHRTFVKDCADQCTILDLTL